MRVQPVLPARGVDLERRPHVVGPGERRVGAPLIEQLGAHLEERRLLRRRLGPGTRNVVPAGAVVLIGCLHGSLLRRKRSPDRSARVIYHDVRLVQCHTQALAEKPGRPGNGASERARERRELRHTFAYSAFIPAVFTTRVYLSRSRGSPPQAHFHPAKADLGRHRRASGACRCRRMPSSRNRGSY